MLLISAFDCPLFYVIRAHNLRDFHIAALLFTRLSLILPFPAVQSPASFRGTLPCALALFPPITLCSMDT
jgi:hypothetical protein